MSKVAVVTGANQGLGFALAEGLASELGPGDVVYLTGRNAERVAAAGEQVAGTPAEVRSQVVDRFSAASGRSTSWTPRSV